MLNFINPKIDIFKLTSAIQNLIILNKVVALT